MGLGRNDPCHCGSGQKYKKCCLAKDEQAVSLQRTQALEEQRERARVAREAAQAEGKAPTTLAPKVKPQRPPPPRAFPRRGF